MAATQQPIVTSGSSKKKSNATTIAIVIATIILAGIAIFTAVRLYQLRQEAVAPTAPVSEPQAVVPCSEECPDSEGILRNCTPPDGDGTSNDSLCNLDRRIESCGGVDFCCPTAGGTWTTNLASCQTTVAPTATSTPASTATATPDPLLDPTGTSTPASTATTTPDTLLDAGVSLPTILGTSIGILIILGSLVLIF